MALLAVVLFSFCTDDDSAKAMNTPTDENQVNVNGKVLVAYFSRANYVPEGTDGVSGATNKAGNTQTVAAYISERMGGTLFEIVPERDYPVSHTECSAIAQEEWRNNERPALRTHVEDMDDYSVVFVGFPIWVYREPAAVLTFLEEYDFSGKTVIPFCTSMAVSVDQSVADFKETLPDADVRQGLRIGYTLPGGWQDDVDEWLDGLNISSGTDGTEELKVKVTVQGQTLTATLLDNATTRAFMEKLPVTLPMMDLYGREMCYRFPEALPTDDVNNCGYEVGEIVYYPPMHSFVIMYAQNGEHFSMQKLGRIDSGISIFNRIGDVDVTFEAMSSSTAIRQIDSPDVSVKAVGGNVVVDAAGNIDASLYDLHGTLLSRSSGDNHVEIDGNGYKGVGIADIRTSGNIRRTKIVLN